MKHCRSCESCLQEPLSYYLKGVEYNQCALDGHHIEEPFFENCDKYVKDKEKTVQCSSFLYFLVEYINEKTKHK